MVTIEGKNVHGNILKAQVAKKRGADRTVFEGIFDAYENYRNRIDVVD